MPETKDVGRFYFHPMKYPIGGAPRFERTITKEIEEPYRKGDSLVVRLGRRAAVVLGRWREPVDVDEDEALLDALEGYEPDVETEEIKTWAG